MPDLKSELAKALNTWTKDDPAAKAEPKPEPTPPPKNGRFFATTNNVTRETFNYVRDNPGVTRSKAVADLKAKGFLDGSVHSLLGQMVKQGLITEVGDDRRMTCVAKEYTPLKGSKVIYRKPQPSKEEIKPKRKYTQRVGRSLPVDAVAVSPPAPMPVPLNSGLMDPTWTADQIMEHLSIKQARSLFDELKKVFGQ